MNEVVKACHGIRLMRTVSPDWDADIVSLTALMNLFAAQRSVVSSAAALRSPSQTKREALRRNSPGSFEFRKHCPWDVDTRLSDGVCEAFQVVARVE